MRITTLISSLIVSLLGLTQAPTSIVVVQPSDTTVCINSQVSLNAIAAPVLYIDTLTNQQLSSDWTITHGTPTIGQNCDPNPDYNHSLTLATDGIGLPTITSKLFNVQCANSGISFQLYNADQSGAMPCEGADEYPEGIAVEYTVNGGATWELLRYIMPHGVDTNVIVTTNGIPSAIIPGDNIPEIPWTTYSFVFPPSVVNQNIQVRLRQNASSGICCDRYSFQELIIFGDQGPCNFASTHSINWSNGATNTSSITATISSDTSFTATVTDNAGNLLGTSNHANIHIHPTNPTFTLDPLAHFTEINCHTDTVFFTFSNITGGIAPYTVEVNNQILTDTVYYVEFSDLLSDTLYYNFTITDACNNTYNDILLIDYDYPVVMNDVFLGYDPTLGTYGTLFIDTIPGVNYTWLNCDSTYQEVDSIYNTIPFTLPDLDNYALQLEYNGCYDTTACINPLTAELKESSLFEVNISPNPTHNTIHLNGENVSINQITIFDIHGRSIQFIKGIDSSNYTLDLSNFSEGTYFIKVNTDKGNTEHRIIKL